MDREKLAQLTKLVRYHILRITHKAGSGHPTSSFSAVELMTMLFFKYLRVDLDNPESLANDRVIFSKGHASALFYSLYCIAGKLTDGELMTYRDFQSPLEGHPTSRFKFTEAATGSLGQGLSIGAGEALGLQKIYDLRFTNYEENHKSYFINHKSVPKVYILLGDGELAEGSVWEAASWASFQKLENLIAICDINRLGQSEATMFAHDLEVYRRRFEAFGWSVIVIDGHDFSQIDAAYQKALNYKAGPVIILAKTKKGKGISTWEDKDGWHNKMLPKEELEKALAEFGKKENHIESVVQKPEKEMYDLGFTNYDHKSSNINHKSVTYPKSDLVPTKKAFGNALERLGQEYPNLFVLDGDVSNSLHTDQFKKAFPERFLQMYIAEQNMVGVATGLAKLGLIPVVSTFASFLTRAHDQIRMIPLTGATVLFHGSYVGVSLGKDGPSQMGLEDIAMYRSVIGSTVLYPADPYATERLTEAMMTLSGVVYIRTTREATPVIYTQKDEFPVGGSKIFPPVRITHNAKLITIIAAGITLHESLKAQKILAEKGIAVRVIDCYSIKPIDAETLRNSAKDSQALVVVEDHYPEGGLGEAVMSALSGMKIPPFYHLSVTKQPMSGGAEELLAYEGIDAAVICATIVHIAG